MSEKHYAISTNEPTASVRATIKTEPATSKTEPATIKTEPATTHQEAADTVCFNGKWHSILRRFSTFEETKHVGDRFLCFSVDRKVNIIGIGVTDIVGDTAKIGIKDSDFYVDDDCDARRYEKGTRFQPQSVERRGNIVRLLSDRFPPTIPHKRYWIDVFFKDRATKTYYCGAESARNGTQTVSVRGGSAEKEEIVTFTFPSADVVKYCPTYKVDNRFLAEIYFTL